MVFNLGGSYKDIMREIFTSPTTYLTTSLVGYLTPIKSSFYQLMMINPNIPQEQATFILTIFQILAAIVAVALGVKKLFFSKKP